MTGDYIDRFHEQVKAGARFVGQGFEKPDDDWNTVFFIGMSETPEGIMAVAFEHGPDGLYTPDQQLVVPIMRTTSLDEAKAAFRRALVVTSRRLRAQAITLVQSCFTAAEEPPPGQRVRDQLNAGEAVAVHTVGPDRELFSIASIDRDGDRPPILGEWEVTDSAMEGSYADALRAAIQPGNASRN